MFARLIAIIKSWANFFIGKAEDPTLLLEQTLVDMREQEIKARKAVATSVADEKRLKKQFEKARDEANDWESKAMFAVNAGDDELAKAALSRHKEAADIAAQFEAQHEKQAESVGELKGALKNMTKRIEEAERKKGLLISKARTAEARKGMEEARAMLTQDSAFATFDRMEAKVDQIEAEAEAASEMADEHTGDDLKGRFEALEADQGPTDALAALKAKMAKQDGLPTPTGVRVPDAEAEAQQAEDEELEALKQQVRA